MIDEHEEAMASICIKSVNAFFMYMHNTAPDEIVDMLFGEVHESYREEWRHRYMQGYFQFWMHLDDDNKAKIMRVALTIYG